GLYRCLYRPEPGPRLRLRLRRAGCGSAGTAARRAAPMIRLARAVVAWGIVLLIVLCGLEIGLRAAPSIIPLALLQRFGDGGRGRGAGADACRPRPAERRQGL